MMSTLRLKVITLWVIVGIIKDRPAYWTGSGWSQGNVLLDAKLYKYRRIATHKAKKLAVSARHVADVQVAKLNLFGRTPQ